MVKLVAEKSIGEEIRQRVPRFIVNAIIIIFLFFLYLIVPISFIGIIVPGLNMSGDYLARLIIILVIVIFLARTLPDALFLADLGVDLFLKHLGVIKEERPIKRAARDVVYIILVILLAAAILPLLSSMPKDLRANFRTLTSLITLGLFLILIYDIGRVLYELVEKKIESFANWLAEQANKGEEGREDD